MSTIDQTGEGGKPTNEPSGDATGEKASAAAPTIEDTTTAEDGGGKPTNEPGGDATGEEAGAAAPTIEDAARPEERGAATIEDTWTGNGGEEVAPRSGETARAHVEQHSPETLRAFTALALLRAVVEEHGLKAKLEGPLLTLDTAIRRAARERAAGGDDEPPVSAQRPVEGGDDDETTTARTLPPNLSTLVLRLNDGAMLVSLEDAGDRDLTGREIIRCMVLTDEESKHALEVADDALSDAAATIIGALPMSAA